MTDRLKECVWFYTGADYLLINAFLWRNKEALEPCLGIVWQNNLDVIREAEAEGSEQRFASSGLDGASLLESYRRRTPDALTDNAKRSMLEQAISDIRLLYTSMQPTKEPIHVIRNVGRMFAIKNVHDGDQIDLLGLTSTSTTGQQIDYGHDDYRKPAQVLEIDVPKGLPALFLENDEHEVLLPPMRYRVKGESVKDGVSTVLLEALHLLDLERLIRSSAEAFPTFFS